MSPRKRVVLLVVIMSLIVLTVESFTIGVLYHTALDEERSRLVEMARSQARLIEAVARFDQQFIRDFPEGSRQATLNQIRDAHARYGGHGRTGEFTLSKRENDQIVFLLSHRHYDMDSPKPVPWNSRLAEPMRRALSGQSGTVIGLDYRGETVLAAYEPVQVLDLGIVAKIDFAEIRAPFLRAMFLSAFIALALIVVGAAIFFKITNPLIDGLQRTVASLEKALGEVNTLRGILPICSFCKKIRDDQGYWDQVDVYIRNHTHVDFSHSICPDCIKTHYPDLDIDT